MMYKTLIHNFRPQCVWSKITYQSLIYNTTTRKTSEEKNLYILCIRPMVYKMKIVVEETDVSLNNYKVNQ